MDFATIRDQFPITKRQFRHDEKSKPVNLIYMDHAASTHAPKPVLDAYLEVMQTTYANIHRGEHTLSCISTDMFDEVPHKVGNFIGDHDLHNSGNQIVLTSNTTSSLDLASHVFANKPGAVLTTLLEHHSNLLPHRRRGETIHTKLLDDGTLNLDDLENQLQNHDIKLVAVSGGSNVTGYMPPVHKIARMAHDAGAKILIDAAQRLAHYPIDVKPMDHPEHLDFLAGAGHKTYAPFGSSFLYGGKEDFDEAEPYIPSGGTVAFVTENTAHYLDGPDRHHFGTPNIAGAIALGKAIDFLASIGMDKVREHELELLEPALKGINEIDGVTVYGDIPLKNKLGVIPFNIEGLDHQKVSHDLDKLGGIATRNGCFCAHPYLIHLLRVPKEQSEAIQQALLDGKNPHMPGAVRASIGIYNNREEIDKFIETVELIATSR